MEEDTWTILNYVLCTIAVSIFVFGAYLHFKYDDSLLWMLSPFIVFLFGLFSLLIGKKYIKKPEVIV